MGRPRIHEDSKAANRARQAAYRERQKASKHNVTETVTPGPDFGLPLGYDWLVRVQNGPHSFGAAVFRDQQRAEIYAEALRSVVQPKVTVTVKRF